MPSESPTIVQAVYSFKGKNNDEVRIDDILKSCHLIINTYYSYSAEF